MKRHFVRSVFFFSNDFLLYLLSWIFCLLWNCEWIFDNFFYHFFSTTPQPLQIKDFCFWNLKLKSWGIQYCKAFYLINVKMAFWIDPRSKYGNDSNSLLNNFFFGIDGQTNEWTNVYVWFIRQYGQKDRGMKMEMGLCQKIKY